MRVLVVEDDAETSAYLCRGLRESGHVVDSVASGLDAVQLLIRESYDAAILDRGLPDLDGLSALKAIRAAGNDTPILLLSALGNTDERVRGLRAGADDYMAKPFSFEELSARLEIISARRRTAAETRLACGDLEMDLLAHTVTRAGRRLALLPREFQLLEELLRNKGRVVTRTALLERVWDYRFDPHTSLIDTHMSRLRKKVDEDFDRPLLHTVRGVGYRLAEQP
jgi:two-component system OmpR family response regulator